MPFVEKNLQVQSSQRAAVRPVSSQKAIPPYDRCPFSRTTIVQHVADPVKEYEARADCAVSGPSDGLPLSTACRRTAGQAGPRVAGLSQSYLRTRLFLAHAPMPLWQGETSNERRLLEQQTPEQRQSRSQESPQTESRWLVRSRRLGMLDAGH